jgi:hypothetical protein
MGSVSVVLSVWRGLDLLDFGTAAAVVLYLGGVCSFSFSVLTVQFVQQ